MEDNFKIILEAILDTTSLSNIKNKLAKTDFEIKPRVSPKEFAKAQKDIQDYISGIAKEIQKTFPEIDEKQATQFAKSYYKNFLSDLKQVNKELAQQDKLISQQQAKAVKYTQSATKQIERAISKYSYGDSGEAQKLLQQLKGGLSNFGDLSQVDKTIASLEQRVNSVLHSLQDSHSKNLNWLNSEIQAEENLQRQKDAFNKKNINYIDLEIQKREEQSRRFSAQLEARMREEQVLAERSQSIYGKIQNKGYEAEIAQVQGRYQQLGLTVDEVNQRLAALRTAYSNLQSATTVDQRIAAEREYQRVLKTTQNELTIAKVDASEYVSVLQQVKLSNKIQAWLKNNTAATKEARMQMQAYFDMLQGGRVTKADFQTASIGYDAVNAQMRQMGKLGSSFADAVKAGVSKFSSWIGASTIVMRTLGEIRKGIQTIVELDAALTNINYTMDVSSQQLRNIGNSSFEMAKNLKASTSNVLSALTLYANANETADSILEKTKTAVMLSNVSGISASDTADMLQGVSEQFEIEQTVDGLNHISDVIQNVSQNLAYDFTKGIGAINEAVSNSGSVAHMAGLSLEEYSAMVGKTIEVTRQAGSTVGNAYKTIFSRITKASAAEGTSEEDISKAEESLRAVNIEVRKSATEFRDVTDILSDLGEVWDELNTVQQSKISFDLAGKLCA